MTNPEAPEASTLTAHTLRHDLLEAHRDPVRARIAETEGHLELVDDKIDIYRRTL